MTSPDKSVPSFSPEQIDRFRHSGIRLDRQGRFWHQGVAVSHKRFRQALLRWIDRLDDGRSILRLDEERYAYLEVEDSHLLVKAMRWWQRDQAVITLNDGSEEQLCYASLTKAPDHALYCAVRESKLIARFETTPYYLLAERIEELPPLGSDRYGLRAAGSLYPIGDRDSRVSC